MTEGEAVAAALRDAGALGEIREFAESTRTAADAAAALGCDVGAIANSLIFISGAEPLLVLTSGAHRVDLRHLARLLGVQEVRRATPEEVRNATGQVIGGVAPLGHPDRLRTLVDVALRSYPVVWAAAGTAHSVFPTSFEELLRITAGEAIAVTADG